MMMKNFRFWALTVLLASTASWGVAATTVIGDFEAGLGGWTVNNGIGTATNFDGAIHATSGAQALSVFSNSGVSGAGNNFNWALTLTDPVLKALPEALLMADVSWTTSEWNPSTGWAQWKEISVNSDAAVGGGWQQAGVLVGDTSNPGSPGGWDPNNFGASNTRTLTWDVSAAITDSAAWKAASYNQVNLAVNWDGLITAGGSFWIDNIRLVTPDIPEPTSLALVGLCGACALLRRR
jgi:hypothetical protein